ncbi:MAG TPA: ABC transporter permease [Candidatus Nocardiopsis merdipullorum]|nr:ABC transporter permease [Candidatus Nocardiopsis merdipullorum]
MVDVRTAHRDTKGALALTMARTACVRLFQVVVLLWAISTALFFLLRLSGDPAHTMAGENASPEMIEQIRVQYGLDGTFLEQYQAFIGNMLVLDFGSSLATGRDAMELVLEQLPPTLFLAVIAIAINVVVAVPLGGWLGARPETAPKRITGVLVAVVQGIPGYVIGLVLIQIFAVSFGILPSVAGSGLSSVLLPALTLASFQVPKLVRVVASSVSESMEQDYVRTALANGANPSEVLFRHAMPNALLATTALIGAQFAFLLSGSLITEYLFNWPGLGLLLVNSVTRLDFPVVQAAVFVIALLVFLVNTAMDLLFQVADPRLRRR